MNPKAATQQRCNKLVSPLGGWRCGLPEEDPAHDPLPLGETPWPESFWQCGVHPFDSTPLDPDDGEPTYWPPEENGSTSGVDQ